MARRIWLVALMLAFSACGNSNGPTTTTTTISNTTTSISTPGTTSTTTSILPQSVHYIGTVTPPGAAALPLDLSLFFNIPGGAVLAGTVVRPAAVTQVTGGYTVGTGAGAFSGTVQGSVDNAIFTGTLTTTLSNACVASRNYSGPLTSGALNWTPGAQGNDCGGASPLNFTVTGAASGTVTSVPIACTYSLSVGSTIEGYPTGASFDITVTAPNGCAWSASSSTPWIHVPANASGSGTGTFTFTVDPNTTGAPRTGSLSIADKTVTFIQSTPNSTTTSSTSSIPTTSTTLTTSTIRSTTSTTTTSVGSSTTTTTPILGTGDFQATLRWDTGGSSSPVDVDIHVIEPSGTEVFWNNRSGPTASLDVDNTVGFGPENIFVASGRAAAGTYQIFVEFFSGLTFPTNATITVRSAPAGGAVQSATFTRTFTAANQNSRLNVANVSFPSGAITATSGTRSIAVRTNKKP